MDLLVDHKQIFRNFQFQSVFKDVLIMGIIHQQKFHPYPCIPVTSFTILLLSFTVL